MQSADEFIRNIKKYLEAPELSREMCYELIDRIIIGGSPKTTGKEREIDIVYKVDYRPSYGTNSINNGYRLKEEAPPTPNVIASVGFVARIEVKTR